MTEESSKAQERGFGQNSLSDSLSTVLKTLEEREKYQHAVRILNYDEETVCPEKGLEEQGEIEAFLDNQGYRLTKIPEYLSAADSLIQGKERLSKLDQILVHYLEREKEKTRNIPPEKSLEFDQIRRGAFVSWLRAKKNSDFSIFAGDLEKVRDAGIEEIRLRGAGTTDLYDQMLDDYEEGITTEDLDAVFSDFLDRMTPLLKKIVKSRKVIRTDFLSRPVTDEQQRRLTNALLKEMGFDFTRGAWAMSEHPFTDNLGKDDSRITTHFMPNAFLSSMYSVLHEGGHALFMQNQPEEDYLRALNDRQTMGQHESVSRFYENRIGRSMGFLRHIFPLCQEIVPHVLKDVSEKEFYEAVNQVKPSLIRTEADEFTYTFHIIIRYELEKEIVNGKVCIQELPDRWNALYEKYLGVRPSNDREGVLQDVHWTDGFGYFPAYALGNMYNAMYYSRMKEDMDPEEKAESGDFKVLNGWMKEHVFKEGNHLPPKDWIRHITGRPFTSKDFLDYLEEKYGALYEL